MDVLQRTPGSNVEESSILETVTAVAAGKPLSCPNHDGNVSGCPEACLLDGGRRWALRGLYVKTTPPGKGVIKKYFPQLSDYFACFLSLTQFIEILNSNFIVFSEHRLVVSPGELACVTICKLGIR